MPHQEKYVLCVGIMSSMALSLPCTAAQRLSMDDTNIRNRWVPGAASRCDHAFRITGLAGPSAPYSWDLVVGSICAMYGKAKGYAGVTA